MQHHQPDLRMVLGAVYILNKDSYPQPERIYYQNINIRTNLFLLIRAMWPVTWVR